jgi:hypothetical protein
MTTLTTFSKIKIPEPDFYVVQQLISPVQLIDIQKMHESDKVI